MTMWRNIVLVSLVSACLTATCQTLFPGADPDFGINGLQRYQVLGGYPPRALDAHPRPGGGFTLVCENRTLIACEADGYYVTNFGRHGRRIYASEDADTYGWYFGSSADRDMGGLLYLAENSFGTPWGLVAMDANGNLDNSFGNAGVWTLTVAGSEFFPWDIVLMSSGGYMVSGGLVNDPTAFVVVKINSNGSLDGSFGNGGITNLPLGHAAGLVRIAPDGRIVCGLNVNNTGLVRLLASGQLDASFGTGGILSSFPTYDFTSIYELTDFAPTADGAILIATTDYFRRLAPDQSADQVFMATTNGGALRLQVQTDGRILRLIDQSQLERRMPNGLLDATFNGTGSVTLGPGYELRNFRLLIDGSLVLVGRNVDYEELIIRLDGTGARIADFGENGETYLNGAQGSSSSGTLDVRSDGAITYLAHGLLIPGVSQNRPVGYLAQFTASGARDTSFSTDGIYKYSLVTNQITARGAGGVLYCYGDYPEAPNTYPRIERYQPDGTQDAVSWGGSPQSTVYFNQLGYWLWFAGDIEVDDEERVYTSAWRDPIPFQPTRSGIKRFLPNGAEDPSFGTNSEFIYDPGVDCGIRELALFPNGDLLAVVMVQDSVDYSYIYRNKLHFLRIAPDGSLVTTFGTGGVVETSIDGLLDHYWLTRACVLSDGRFVIGAAPPQIGTALRVARYLSDGSPDLSLEGTGLTTFDSISDFNLVHGENLMVYPDGSMVMVAPNPENDRVLIQKKYADGSPDLSFSQDGSFQIEVPGVALMDPVAAMAPDGNIILAGTAVNIDPQTQNFMDDYLIRLLSDPSIGAAEFNNGGKAGGTLLSFPIPSTGLVTVMVPEDMVPGRVGYKLLKTDGCVVSSGTANATGADPRINLSLNDLPNGVYLLELSNEDHVRSARLLLSR